MKIPFDIPHSKDKKILKAEIEKRLKILVLFNKKFKGKVSLFPVEEMVSAISAGNKLPKKLTGPKSLHRINEFDLAESFVTYIFNNGNFLKDDSIKFLDDGQIPTPDKEGKERVKALREIFTHDGEVLRHWSYARIRAKLIYWELVTIINKDESVLLELAEICPKYLGSSFVQKRIHQTRYKNRHRGAKDSFLVDIGKSIKGNNYAKPRKYSYWFLDFYYGEVSACIRTYHKLKDEKQKTQYLKSISAYWKISKDVQNRIEGEPKKYSLHTVDAMIDRGFIEDANTYTRTIKPQINLIKENIKYLRACQPVVEKFLDVPQTKPEIFEQIYIWDEVEQYDFKELQNYQPEKDMFHLGSILMS